MVSTVLSCWSVTLLGAQNFISSPARRKHKIKDERELEAEVRVINITNCD